MDTNDAYEIVLEAASRRLRDLLNEALKYEALQMPSIVEGYKRDFIGPLTEAIKIVKESR